MKGVEKTALQTRLDALASRLRKRMKDLTKSGEFSDVREALLTKIQRRYDALSRWVRETETGGSTRELLKAEFERDISSSTTSCCSSKIVSIPTS